MKVELDRDDLIYLVKGCGGSYAMLNHPLALKADVKIYGDNISYNSLSTLNETELYELYIACKNSWN